MNKIKIGCLPKNLGDLISVSKHEEIKNKISKTPDFSRTNPLGNENQKYFLDPFLSENTKKFTIKH